jgi:small-conductance mechanosensitive channel
VKPIKWGGGVIWVENVNGKIEHILAVLIPIAITLIIALLVWVVTAIYSNENKIIQLQSTTDSKVHAMELSMGARLVRIETRQENMTEILKRVEDKLNEK